MTSQPLARCSTELWGESGRARPYTGFILVTHVIHSFCFDGLERFSEEEWPCFAGLPPNFTLNSNIG